jgi:hypothetical protein
VMSFTQVKPKSACRTSVGEASLRRLPITTPSSASCSTRWLMAGKRTSSSGPHTALGGLRNKRGSLGTSLPSSLACAA